MDENRRETPFHKTIMFVVKLAVFGVPIWFFIAFLMPQGGGQAVWCAIYALVLGLLSLSFGCYQIGVYRLRTMLWSFCTALLFTNAVAVLQIWLIYDILSLGRFTLLWLVQCMASVGMYVVANGIYFSISPPRRLLAVCRGTRTEIKMIQRVAENKQRFVLSEILSSTVGEAAIKNAIDGVPAVLLGDIDKELRDSLTSYCFENNKRLFIVPNIQDVLLHEAHLTQISDSVVFMCKNRGMTSEQAIMKRTVDILLSTLGLLLLSPVLLATALMVKITSKGPVLYRQIRVTKDGDEFTLYKFRSMVNDAEKDGKAVLACRHDERITPVGRIIRRLRIDELPQLWNILKGDMSIVGPRPERPEIMEQFIKTMPSFRYRLKVKAGLTGYAQVFGRYNTPFEEKVKMDVYYIAHYSLMLDVQLILSTVRILFMRDSAEGIEEVIGPAPPRNTNGRQRHNRTKAMTQSSTKKRRDSMAYASTGRRAQSTRRYNKIFSKGNDRYEKDEIQDNI